MRDRTGKVASKYLVDEYETDEIVAKRWATSCSTHIWNVSAYPYRYTLGLWTPPNPDPHGDTVGEH